MSSWNTLVMNPQWTASKDFLSFSVSLRGSLKSVLSPHQQKLSSPFLGIRKMQIPTQVLAGLHTQKTLPKFWQDLYPQALKIPTGSGLCQELIEPPQCVCTAVWRESILLVVRSLPIWGFWEASWRIPEAWLESLLYEWTSPWSCRHKIDKTTLQSVHGWPIEFGEISP